VQPAGGVTFAIPVGIGKLRVRFETASGPSFVARKL
jgi:hypothetical protein